MSARVRARSQLDFGQKFPALNLVAECAASFAGEASERMIKFTRLCAPFSWPGAWQTCSRGDPDFGPSESFRKNKRKKGLHRECRFPEVSRKKQGKKVMGKVIFREKETKRVDLHIHTTIYGGWRRTGDLPTLPVSEGGTVYTIRQDELHHTKNPCVERCQIV